MKTRMSTKGQLIIPKEIRERHGWGPGSELELEDTADGVVVRAEQQLPRTTLAELVGCTGYRGQRRSLADMEAAIAKGARDRS